MKWLFTLFCLIPIGALAQEFAQDTNYVQQISDENNAALRATLQAYRVNFQGTAGQQAIFQNRVLSVGPRIKIKNIGLSLSLPIFSLTRASLLSSQQIGFSTNFTPDKWYLLASAYYLGGFTGLEELRNGNRPFIRTRDAMVAVDLSATHIFNARHYALPAALKMVNRQKKTAASLLLTFPASFQYFQTDTLRLPQNNNTDALIRELRSFNGGLALGYAGTLVKDYWAITGIYTFGVVLRSLFFKSVDSRANATRQLINPYVKVAGSLVYNRPISFFGLVGEYRPGIVLQKGLNTQTRFFTLQLVAGRRFF